MHIYSLLAIISISQVLVNAEYGQQIDPDIRRFPMLLKQLVSLARYTNLWTTELCEGLPEHSRQGCVQCFITVGTPVNNVNFLSNFSDCAKVFLPENFKLCYNIATGMNISIPIGEIEVNLNPQNDISRGKMVIKCLKVTTKGLKGSMCLNQLKTSNPTMFSGEMSALDFILLNNCYQKEKLDGMFEENMLMPAMGTQRGKFRLSQLSSSDDFTQNYKTAMINLLTTFLSNEEDKLGIDFENFESPPSVYPLKVGTTAPHIIKTPDNDESQVLNQQEDTEFIALDTEQVETTFPQQPPSNQEPTIPQTTVNTQLNTSSENNAISDVVSRSKRCV